MGRRRRWGMGSVRVVRLRCRRTGRLWIGVSSRRRPRFRKPVNCRRAAMASPPPTVLGYQQPVSAGSLERVGEALRIEQPAPGGATFVAIHLRTFFMLGLLTALLASVGSMVARYGWPGS